ncbi:MAG: flavin reductase family protein [Kiritimatiellae bacterium]|nr:flavin reductase family protein [Kiritimatiellia bacterium]MDD5522429.1 flavin reductase family protein [Kiritimatiellia bacterium]
MQKKTILKKASARKYPEQVVLVTTKNHKGKTNAMAVGWVAIASGEPMMFVLGIDNGAYTYELIQQTKEFVVAYPGEKMAKQVLYVGKNHGQNRDKIKECGMRIQKASKVRAPLVADAVANFECKLVDIFKPGDCPLVVGKVVAVHENRNPSVRRLYTVAPGHTMGSVRIIKRG